MGITPAQPEAKQSAPQQRTGQGTAPAAEKKQSAAQQETKPANQLNLFPSKKDDAPAAKQTPGLQRNPGKGTTPKKDNSPAAAKQKQPQKTITRKIRH